MIDRNIENEVYWFDDDSDNIHNLPDNCADCDNIHNLQDNCADCNEVGYDFYFKCYCNYLKKQYLLHLEEVITNITDETYVDTKKKAEDFYNIECRIERELERTLSTKEHDVIFALYINKEFSMLTEWFYKEKDNLCPPNETLNGYMEGLEEKYALYARGNRYRGVDRHNEADDAKLNAIETELGRRFRPKEYFLVLALIRNTELFVLRMWIDREKDAVDVYAPEDDPEEWGVRPW